MDGECSDGESLHRTPGTGSAASSVAYASDSPKRSVDEFGFFADSADANGPLVLGETEKMQYRKREAEWLSLLDKWGSNASRHKSKIKKLCRMGIPDSVRASAWAAMAGVDKLRVPGLFEELVGTPETPAIYDIIERDVNRCYPNHTMFNQAGGEGQLNLRKVLRAYAVYNPELGYCQGMGMLVGLMLMRMPPEETFWLLVSTLKNYIPGYHSETLYELRVDAACFELALQRYLGPVAKYLAKMDVRPITFLTNWFLTIYTMALPWRTTLRVWDMFYCDGPKALFRVGMGILSSKKAYLMKECPTAADCIGCLLRAPHEFEDADALIAVCLKIKIKHGDLDKFRARAKKRKSLDQGLDTAKSL